MSIVSTSRRSRRAVAAPQSFPQTLAWREPLPNELQPSDAWDEKSDNWRRWKRHLLDRPPALERLAAASGTSWALVWGLSPGLPESELLTLLQPGPSNRRRRSLSRLGELTGPWLAESAGTANEYTFAWECLALCHSLPELAATLPCDRWFELLSLLLNVASDAPSESHDGNPLPSLLLAAELPLLLAGLFPEIEQCGRLASQGQRAAVAAAVRLLDGEGLPRARHLPLHRPLLASWTRCRLLPSWTFASTPLEDDPAQWSHFVRNALRCIRGDGSPLFVESGNEDRQLFAAALSTLDDSITLRLAEVAGAGSSPTKRAVKALAKKHPAKKRVAVVEPPLPEAGYESDWSEAAVLRTDWGRQANALGVTYHDGVVRTELIVQGELLWSGVWGLQAAFNGQPLRLISPWESVCWFSDADVDFLELQATCANDVKVQRQLLLARKDRFLLLADVLLAPSEGTLEYLGSLPLGEGVVASHAAETRECHLQRGKRRVLVIPPALPEWRRDPRGGTLTSDEGGLHLQQSAGRKSLYCPLFFDLDAKRNRGPLTWRQLTVAQDRRNVTADVAVGYRVQVAKEQFVIYRSLGPAANRTLLGSNLVTECMVGRFTKHGEVETVLEIE